MVDLELVGIHADGENLILIGPDGERHRLAIDEALRAAVRRDRPQLEKLRVDSAIRPRDIQVLIRAGASAEDVAQDSGLPIEQVRRYEGPVVAERTHVAQRARLITIGRDAGSPELGDLVIDRLAARGVDAESVTWDARRRGGEPWEVVARFVAGDREREAAWQVDLASRTLTALDDESRWLSETELGGAGPRRHLSSVRAARLYDVETDADIAPSLSAVDAVIRDSRPFAGPEHEEVRGPAERTPSDTEALLDELNASRGVRQRVEIDDDALAAEAVKEPMLWEDPPPAHPAASHPEEALDAGVVPIPPHLADPDPEPEGPSGKARKAPKRHRRTSVPSWDEIVFGAKND